SGRKGDGPAVCLLHVHNSIALAQIKRQVRRASDGFAGICHCRYSLLARAEAIEVSSNAKARFVLDLESALTDPHALSRVAGLGEILVLVDLAEPEEFKVLGVNEEGVAGNRPIRRHHAVRLDNNLAIRPFINVRIGNDTIVLAVADGIAERGNVSRTHEG